LDEKLELFRRSVNKTGDLHQTVCGLHDLSVNG
jgi:hypothetical protein